LLAVANKLSTSRPNVVWAYLRTYSNLSTLILLPVANYHRKWIQDLDFL